MANGRAFPVGLPADRLRACMGIVRMLERFVDTYTPRPAQSPPARLKRLIDEDPRQEQGLDELSRRCSYSPDHLRMLFRRAYRTSPRRYRNRRRLAVAMELIAGSRLSIKQIGARVGCRHMSHFTALFRKEFRMTPSDAVAKYRRV
ncbi:MAG: helix-turn-helix domain-containing protein [Chitinivibrionales bacterium]|nr:helix-turn-helix domain-containing protein [Chitinivibrionales bacterium]